MEPMKPIDDQLDEHFGVDFWHKAEGVVMEGDVFYTSGTIFKAIQIGLPATSGYYRAKPKQPLLITEQLDDHFGAGCWQKLKEGDVIVEGDLVKPALSLGLQPALGMIGDESNGDNAYRAKPKPKLKPEQSEKFWIVCRESSEGEPVPPFETHFLATEEAIRLAEMHRCNFVVFESVGIARAPKAVEYEEF